MSDFEKTDGYPWKFEPSFLKALELRGYDLTTIRFSIHKTCPVRAQ